jgi:hypothetical protein
MAESFPLERKSVESLSYRFRLTMNDQLERQLFIRGDYLSGPVIPKCRIRPCTRAV